MTIDQWVKKVGGASKAAQLLNANVRSIHQWRTRAFIPNDRMKMKIVELSKGKCSYKNMIEDFFAKIKN